GEAGGAGRRGGMARPADRAGGKSARAFDPPADVDVAFAAFPGRAGPHVVPAAGPAAGVVLEDVQVDAVAVWESGARVGPGTGQNAVGSAEPVAERVEMVDAHDEL